MGMGDKILIDTTVLIDFLRGNPEATAFILEHESDGLLATTVINSFEVYIGAYRSRYQENNLRLVTDLVSRLHIIPLSPHVSRRAAEICSQLEKKGTSVDFKDLLIGVTALEEGYHLKTNNQKHFMHIPGLTVL